MLSEKLPEKLRPYAGIIYFMLVLFCAHFFWKFSMNGDETDTVITWFGLDISQPFNAMARHVAEITHRILQSWKIETELFANNVIQHDNRVAVRIVWSCTGIKQAYIFVCLILFYKSDWLKKIWFIPLGLVLVYVINMLRIAAITALVKYYPQQFDFMHEHLFKYLFYVFLFGLWVIWDEKIATKFPN
jgi:exosortase/archaeosortase family protein